MSVAGYGTRLILIRHGESVSTVERRIGGSLTCGGLTALGRKQAEALAARLVRTGEIAADVLVSSTMRRAVETAEVLAPALGELPIQLDPGVCEHEPGPEVDGLSFDEFEARYGRPDWDARPVRGRFPRWRDAGRLRPSGGVRAAPARPRARRQDGRRDVPRRRGERRLALVLGRSARGWVRAVHEEHVARPSSRTRPALAVAPLQRLRPPRGASGRVDRGSDPGPCRSS